MPDWLVPLDNQLCSRLARCTACGTPAEAWRWVGIVDLASGLSLAYQLCARCKAAPGTEAVLARRFETLYGGKERPNGHA
jgi:hypothetical protein